MNLISLTVTHGTVIPRRFPLSIYFLSFLFLIFFVPQISLADSYSRDPSGSSLATSTVSFTFSYSSFAYGPVYNSAYLVVISSDETVVASTCLTPVSNVISGTVTLSLGPGTYNNVELWSSYDGSCLSHDMNFDHDFGDSFIVNLTSTGGVSCSLGIGIPIMFSTTNGATTTYYQSTSTMPLATSDGGIVVGMAFVLFFLVILFCGLIFTQVTKGRT